MPNDFYDIEQDMLDVTHGMLDNVTVRRSDGSEFDAILDSADALAFSGMAISAEYILRYPHDCAQLLPDEHLFINDEEYVIRECPRRVDNGDCLVGLSKK